MAGDKPNGKGKGKTLKEALEAAKSDQGGDKEWYKVTQILVAFENPLRDYHVTIEPHPGP